MHDNARTRIGVVADEFSSVAERETGLNKAGARPTEPITPGVSSSFLAAQTRKGRPCPSAKLQLAAAAAVAAHPHSHRYYNIYVYYTDR